MDLNGASKIAKNRPKCSKTAGIGQKMANFREFPIIGTFCAKISNGWNFCRKNFQGLELFEARFPKIGTFAPCRPDNALTRLWRGISWLMSEIRMIGWRLLQFIEETVA